MRFVAFILTTLSLVLGAVAATTAYLPKTSLDDELLIGLRMAAPAGIAEPAETEAAAEGDDDAVVAPADDDPQPLVKATDPETGEATVIDAAVLKTLRDAGVERVRVKDFPSSFGDAIARWTEWWWFAIAVAGFIASAMISRIARKARIMAGESAAGSKHAAPSDVVSSMRAVVAGLIEETPAMLTRRDRLDAIIDRVGGLQAEEIPSLVDRRETLVGVMGLGKYAALMDVFSSAERALNRAWSAAADGDEGEAMSCLLLAADRLVDVEALVPKGSAGPRDPNAPMLPGTRSLELPDVSFGKTTPGAADDDLVVDDGVDDGAEGDRRDDRPGRGDVPLV